MGKKRKTQAKQTACMTPEQARFRIEAIDPSRYRLESLYDGRWRVWVKGSPEPLPIGVLPTEVRAWDGSIIGFYEIKGTINERHREALLKFGSLTKAFRDAINIMAKLPKQPGAQDFDKVCGVPGVDMDMREFQNLRKRYDAAFVAIGSNAHKREVSAVLRDEQAISCERLRSASERLAQHFDRR